MVNGPQHLRRAARTGARLLAAAALLAVTGCGRTGPAPAPPPAAPAPPAVVRTDADVTAFGGSAACAPCHAREHATWARSTHATHGSFAVRPDEGADGAVGSKWMQAYVRRDATGLSRIVPRCFDLRERRWLEVSSVLAEIAGRFGETPDVAPAPMPTPLTRRTFETDCAGCHASQPTTSLDVEHGRLVSAHVEASIGCEACHGPGRAHVEAWRAARTDAPMPRLGTLAPRASLAACTRCHGGPPTASDFAPADADAYVAWVADRRGTFPDGRAAGQVYQGQGLLASPCHRAGGLVCTDCHDAHGPGLRAEGDALCVRCHRDAASTAHTHHAPAGDGARCLSCHMPRLLPGLLAHQRDHRISVPLPADRTTPDACTACHRDHDKTWADEAWRRLWGEPPAGTVEVVAALARARGGHVDRDALRRGLGHADPIVRANAARALGDATSLVGDPVPEVRLACVDALPRNAAGDAALARLLGDAEPKVRAAAALSAALRGSVAGGTVADADLVTFTRLTRQDPWSRLALAERARRRGDAAGAARWSLAAFLADPLERGPAATAASDLLAAGDATTARAVLRAAIALEPDEDDRARLRALLARTER